MALVHLWSGGLIRLIQQLVCITFDLTSLRFDESDLDLDLRHGRE